MKDGRIELEPIQPRHAKEMFEVLSPQEIYEFIPDTPPKSVAALTERYQKLSLEKSPDGYQIWKNWVIRNIGADRLIGYIQATIDHKIKEADIVYVLHPASWGQGFAEEACRLMIADLQQNFQLKLLWVKLDSQNIRSVQLMKRLGFQKRTHLIKSETIRGELRDEITMARLIER
ncbi:MAG: GNAT family N-acetyltransferase [Deltaproteobacteria bacterium]|nr:GNAT family N-acetyltransferase [Deltaproteobacteria bacterium]